MPDPSQPRPVNSAGAAKRGHNVDGMLPAEHARCGQCRDPAPGGLLGRRRLGGGRDTVRGAGGEDALFGGPRHDEVFGGGGDDFMQGNLANDLLNGGPGDDAMDGDNPPVPNPPVNDPPGDADRCDGASGTDTAVRCEKTSNVP